MQFVSQLRRASTLLIACSLAAAATACSDDGTGPDVGPPSDLVLISGEGQEGAVGEALANPVVVHVTDEEGNSVPDVTVTWSAAGQGAQADPAQSQTGGDGRAETFWTLGGAAGEQELTASVSGVSPVTATATALAGPPDEIEIAAGDEQEAEAETVLPDSLVVEVTDEFGNPVEGAQVTWEVTAGGGSVSPASDETDEDGLARTEWTLGDEVGEQTVEASAGEPAVTFTATADEPEPEPGDLEVVDGDGQEGTVDTALPDPVVALVTNGEGDPLPGVTVTWTAGDGSVDPEESVTDEDGLAETSWTLGTEAGTQSLEAVAGELDPVAATATALAGPPDEIEIAAGDEQEAEAETVLPDSLVVEVTDEFGNPVEDAQVTWEVTAGGGSVSPASDETDEDGLARTEWTLGDEVGEQTVEASAGEPAVTFTATADEPTTPGDPPSLDAISPDTVVAGGTATLTGENFSPDASQNEVMVNGVEATVTAASETELTITLPDRSELECAPTQTVAVSVEVGGEDDSLDHPLRVARRIALDAGQSEAILDQDDVACNEVVDPDGTYAVSVFSTSTVPAQLVSFELEGLVGDGEGGVVAAADAARWSPDRTRTARASARDLGPGDPTRFHAGHAYVLEMNRRLYEQHGPPPAGAPRLAADGVFAEGLPDVGDIETFRIPDLDASNSCQEYKEVEARTVYVGSRGVVFEDVDAPAAEEADDELELMGEEFDDIQYDVVSDNFGDPLAYNDQTSGNERILMLFSHEVNDFDRAVNGFVFSGDFQSRDDCASSSETEIFYARVPPSDDEDDIRNWLRGMRTTVIHEVKHIASYAARISLGSAGFDEIWLEEATARASEELFAREIFGYGRHGRTTYDESIYCEVRSHDPATWPECEGSPQAMIVHFNAIHTYYQTIETLTPIGNFTVDPDATFYGTGWLLTRWASDHYGTSDAQFYSDLNQTTQVGVENLEARTGRSFAEMLADWTLSLAVDEREGFVPDRPELEILGWDTRDIFEGLNSDFEGTYEAFPLAVRELSFGTFLEEVSELRAGTAAIFELEGNGSEPQILHLRGAGGGDAPDLLRIAIVRIN